MTYNNGIFKPVVFPIIEGLNQISTTEATGWNIYSTIEASVQLSWSIPTERIASSVGIEFDTTGIVNILTMPVVYGLVRPIVYPIDERLFKPGISWDNYLRISAPVPYTGTPEPIEDQANFILLDQAGRYLDSEYSDNSSEVLWNVISRINIKKSINWNVLITEYTSQKTSWSVRERLSIPSLANGRWTNSVVAPTVHPIDSRNIPAASEISWAVQQRVSVAKTIRYRVKLAVEDTAKVSWDTNILTVTSEVAANWNTKASLNAHKAASWVTSGRLTTKKLSKWSTRELFSISESAHWNCLQQVIVPILSYIETENSSILYTENTIDIDIEDTTAQAYTATWNTINTASLAATIRWATYSHLNTPISSSWNNLFKITIVDYNLTSSLPGNVCASVVHPIDTGNLGSRGLPAGILSRTVHPIDYSSAASSMLANPDIAWRLGINPSGRVAATIQIAYRDLLLVSEKLSIEWKTVARLPISQESLFNVLYPVEVTEDTSWIIGAWVPSHIRQTAQERIDFTY